MQTFQHNRLTNTWWQKILWIESWSENDVPWFSSPWTCSTTMTSMLNMVNREHTVPCRNDEESKQIIRWCRIHCHLETIKSTNSGSQFKLSDKASALEGLPRQWQGNELAWQYISELVLLIWIGLTTLEVVWGGMAKPTSWHDDFWNRQ